MLEFLTRGPLMDEAGDAGGGGAAVMDVSSDYGGAAPDPEAPAGTDGEVHDAEFVEPVEGEPPASGQEPQQALVKAGERAVQNGKFSPAAKAAIDTLRATDPKLAQQMAEALMVREFFRSQFPGGKKEVATLKALAEQHGGEQGIAQLQNIAAQMEEIDRLYESSDPQFIENITQTDEGKQGFIGLMAPALAKFAQLAPEVYSHHMAREFAHLMNEGGIPTTFSTQAAIMNRASKALSSGNHELAASFLAEIIENHNSLHDFVQKVYGASKNAPAATAATPATDERARKLAEREANLTKQEWQSAVGQERRRIFSKTWAELTKGRTISADQDANIKGFYELRMAQKLKQWQSNEERFLKNSDRDGYMREQFAFFKEAIPDALRKAMQQAMPAKPGPKANGKVESVPRGTPASTNGTNVVRVPRMPSTGELDPVRTTSAMLSQNQAVRKDGTVVQWA